MKLSIQTLDGMWHEITVANRASAEAIGNLALKAGVHAIKRMETYVYDVSLTPKVKMLVKLENGKLIRITAGDIEECNRIHEDFMSNPNYVLLTSDKDITGEYKQQIEFVDFQEAMKTHVPVIKYTGTLEEKGYVLEYVLHAQDEAYVWYEAGTKRVNSVSTSMAARDIAGLSRSYEHTMKSKLQKSLEIEYKILSGEIKHSIQNGERKLSYK